MNAGGVPNTCKSNGARVLAFWLSGERVSNTSATYPEEGDNGWKRLLIPHKLSESDCSAKAQAASGGAGGLSGSW
jgi:hypothetical protein